MTTTNRIVLNALATYGRSLLGVALGLFSARWLLIGLGEVDLGLFNVVGGMIPFVRILNGIVQASVARYYAYVIGQGSLLHDKDKASDILRQWFSTAVMLHLIIPSVLVVAFYPVGIYAVHNWFVIPADRIVACEWVVRGGFLSTFIVMASAPYIAMYTAKQLITELAIFGVLQTLLYALSAYVLLYSKMDRLILFSCLSCGYLSLTSIAQVLRASYAFKACRLKISYMFNLQRIKALFSFSGWTFLCAFGFMAKEHGSAFLINRHFGASVNAAFSIANQVSNQTNSLSNALEQAIAPAVTTAEGASDRDRAITLANRSCKMTTILMLLFSVPVISEVDTLLRLWLIHPPEYTAMLCVLVIVSILVNHLTQGYVMAIEASGKIAIFQSVSGVIYLLTIPVLWLMIRLGTGAKSVGLAFIIISMILTTARVLMGHCVLGISIMNWLKKIVAPIMVVALASASAAYMISWLFPPVFLRAIATFAACTAVLVAMSWGVAFDDNERMYFRKMTKNLVNRMMVSKRK